MRETLRWVLYNSKMPPIALIACLGATALIVSGNCPAHHNYKYIAVLIF
jgi:hypothetical protein